MSFTLSPLPYGFDALEPYIDAQTMELHYTKHHQTYLTNLNAALEKASQLAGKPIEELLTYLDTYKIPDDLKTAIKNNGGGYYNHSLFWLMMTPDNNKRIMSETFKKTIETTFGGLDQFKEKFTATALARFGSGWAWLVADEAANLTIISTPNQDSPIMNKLQPILGLDVWEHAYYLKYQNRRADYVNAWWNVINWQHVEDLYKRITVE